MRSRHVCAAAAALGLWAAVLAPAAGAAGGGAHNVVQAVATADDRFVHRARTQVVPFGGESAAAENTAVALSRDCTGCRTQAAAFQVAFLTGEPDAVAPRNSATSVNLRCTDCFSYAFAYQCVVTTPGKVVLSPQARQRVAALGVDADDVVAQRRSGPELDAALRDIAAELRSVVNAELDRAGYDVACPAGTSTDAADEARVDVTAS